VVKKNYMAHLRVYESKQIYWDLQRLNCDVKLMWFPSGQMTVANDHRILARPTMIKQWQHGRQTGKTGRFTHSIRPVISVTPWFYGQAEERSIVTTVSRVMFDHCSIRDHLERFKIVGDLICVCMMNYETVDQKWAALK
jgi:hypothetical protein